MIATDVDNEVSLETPEHLMTRAAEGRLTKHALASYLTPAARRVFLDACSTIELAYTDECATDPCLAAGCSMDAEVCLQPVLEAGTTYHQACDAEWASLYAVPENRV